MSLTILGSGWPVADLDAPARVILAGMEFHTVPPADLGREGTFHVTCSSRIQGWGVPAPTRPETFPSRTGHGQQVGLMQYGSRPLILTGFIVPTTDYGPGSVTDAETVLARFERGTLQVVERDGLAREADVRRAAVPEITSYEPDERLAEFTLSLVADDPLMYGMGYVDLPAGTSLLPNSGDAQAWPVIEASGPLTFYISHPGASAAAPWKANVPSGKHVIHTRTGRMYNAASGAQVPNSLFGPMPYVLPGGSEWTITGMSSGLIRVRRWEAWT